jgi:FkbM family methyltransferase
MAVQILEMRRRYHGDGVVAIDCGANIGVHTIEWATAMTGWGSVVAIEAQERIYYALAGNIAINNCFNAICMNAAVSSSNGTMRVPVPDYLTASSFGSLELQQRDGNEFIGQDIDYSDEKTVDIQKMTLDTLNLPRVDMIKIDIEGMELEALHGARGIIEKSRPVLLIESIKADREALRVFLQECGYRVIDAGINILAIHLSDPTLTQLNPEAPAQASSAA